MSRIALVLCSAATLVMASAAVGFAQQDQPRQDGGGMMMHKGMGGMMMGQGGQDQMKGMMEACMNMMRQAQAPGQPPNSQGTPQKKE